VDKPGDFRIKWPKFDLQVLHHNKSSTTNKQIQVAAY
jgi:hypothetical protein